MDRWIREHADNIPCDEYDDWYERNCAESTEFQRKWKKIIAGLRNTNESVSIKLSFSSLD